MSEKSDKMLISMACPHCCTTDNYFLSVYYYRGAQTNALVECENCGEYFAARITSTYEVEIVGVDFDGMESPPSAITVVVDWKDPAKSAKGMVDLAFWNRGRLILASNTLMSVHLPRDSQEMTVSYSLDKRKTYTSVAEATAAITEHLTVPF